MLKVLKLLIGGKQNDRSVAGNLLMDIREAIKGKELDPNQLIELQSRINEIEAHHRSIFVAGWRPAIGWCGALVIAYHYIVQPFLIWILALNGIDIQPPSLALNELWPVISGMLGIATLRSYDKRNGKSS